MQCLPFERLLRSSVRSGSSAASHSSRSRLRTGTVRFALMQTRLFRSGRVRVRASFRSATAIRQAAKISRALRCARSTAFLWLRWRAPPKAWYWLNNLLHGGRSRSAGASCGARYCLLPNPRSIGVIFCGVLHFEAEI